MQIMAWNTLIRTSENWTHADIITVLFRFTDKLPVKK